MCRHWSVLWHMNLLRNWFNSWDAASNSSLQSWHWSVVFRGDPQREDFSFCTATCGLKTSALHRCWLSHSACWLSHSACTNPQMPLSETLLHGWGRKVRGLHLRPTYLGVQAYPRSLLPVCSALVETAYNVLWMYWLFPVIFEVGKLFPPGVSLRVRDSPTTLPSVFSNAFSTWEGSWAPNSEKTLGNHRQANFSTKGLLRAVMCWLYHTHLRHRHRVSHSSRLD